MIRTPFVVGLLCAVCSACSSSSSEPSGAAGNAGNGCPALSGAWEIKTHCESTLIGMTLQVTEKDCVLSCAAPFQEFHGSVTTDGKITMSGPQDCTGTATGNAISMDCTPTPCPVELARVAR